MKRHEVLAAAHKAVNERPGAYGSPEDNFGRIAALWSVHLQKQITSTDVAVMMALLKIARLQSNPSHEDSWVDLAGYAACGAECTA